MNSIEQMWVDLQGCEIESRNIYKKKMKEKSFLDSGSQVSLNKKRNTKNMGKSLKCLSPTQDLGATLNESTEIPWISHLFDSSKSSEEIFKLLMLRWSREKSRMSDPSISIRQQSMHNILEDLRSIVDIFEISYRSNSESVMGINESNPNQDTGMSMHELNPGADTRMGINESYQNTDTDMGTGMSITSYNSKDESDKFSNVMEQLLDNLGKPLFKRFNDQGEKCRELAIRITTILVRYSSDLTGPIAYLFPALFARGLPKGAEFDSEAQMFIHNLEAHAAYQRGVAIERQDRHDLLCTYVVEPSEEIRLLLCDLVGTIIDVLSLKKAGAILRPYFDDIVTMLACQLRDPYPALRAATCQRLERLASDSEFELGMKFYAVGLARSILPILRHRHAKVRTAAVRALTKVVMIPDRAKCKGAGTSVIVDLVGFQEDNVIPISTFYGRGDTIVNSLADLVWDPSLMVRTETVKMLSAWLTEIPDRYDHNMRLLPYLLAALNDEAAAVSEIAMNTLQICGAEYEREHAEDILQRRQYGVDGDIHVNHSKPLPPPFITTGRPRIGIRLFARGLARRFLKPLLSELGNWISQTRVRSALLLRTLMVLCEESLIMEAHHIVPGLHNAFILATQEKDSKLEKLILEISELVGRYISPDAYIPLILPRLNCDSEVISTGTDINLRSAYFVILSMLITGTSRDTINNHVIFIVNCVTTLQSTEIDPPVIRSGALKVLSSILQGISGTPGLHKKWDDVTEKVILYIFCGGVGEGKNGMSRYELSTDEMKILELTAKLGCYSNTDSLIRAKLALILKHSLENYPSVLAWAMAFRAHVGLMKIMTGYPLLVRGCGTELVGLIDLSKKMCQSNGEVSIAASEYLNSFMVILTIKPDEQHNESWHAELNQLKPNLLALVLLPDWHKFKITQLDLLRFLVNIDGFLFDIHTDTLFSIGKLALHFVNQNGLESTSRLRALISLNIFLVNLKKVIENVDDGSAYNDILEESCKNVCIRMCDVDNDVALQAVITHETLLSVMENVAGCYRLTLSHLVETCIGFLLAGSINSGIFEQLERLLKKAINLDSSMFMHILLQIRKSTDMHDCPTSREVNMLIERLENYYLLQN